MDAVMETQTRNCMRSQIVHATPLGKWFAVICARWGRM